MKKVIFATMGLFAICTAVYASSLAISLAIHNVSI